ncbi:MAG: hypothetical protein RIR96_1603 [Bacteroidota bacterium]|jgi:fucose 4-O-acetylase-like acetyltransferase
MLSVEENDFLRYWERVRLEYSQTSSKIKRGIPSALLFSFSILLSIILVYFLSPEWYTKISQKAGKSTLVILIAIMITAFFFSYMRMHYQWEMNEQHYRELLFKLKKEKPEEQKSEI